MHPALTRLGLARRALTPAPTGRGLPRRPGVSPVLSADGRWLAYLRPARGRTAVAVVDRTTGRRIRNPDRGEVTQVAFPDRPGRRIAWIENGTTLVVVDGTDRVVSTAPGSEASIECWPGDVLWCQAGTGADRTLYRVDGAGIWHPVASARAGLTLADVAADGRLLATFARDGRLQAAVAIGRPNAGGALAWAPVVEAVEPGEAVAAVGWLPDRHGVLLITNLGRELRALMLAAAGPPLPIVARSDAELESVALSRDRVRALLVWNVGGCSELEVVELSGRVRRRRSAATAGVVFGADLDAAGTVAVAAVSSVDEPPQVVELPLGAPFAAQSVSKPGRGRARLLHFDAADGLPLSGWFYPATDPSGRVVLTLHGGPDAQERPLHNPWHRALMERGLSVFAPNVRGSRGFGRSFGAADDKEGRFAARRDVLSAAAYARDGLGAESLGVLGVSYGGYLALCALQQAPELFGCGATVSGVVDLAAYVAQTAGWRAPVAAAEFGDPATDSELLAALSPWAALDQTAAPLLIVHGSDDIVVPAAHAVELATRLRRLGKPVRLRLVRGAGHHLGRAQRSVALLLARWFETRLDQGL